MLRTFTTFLRIRPPQYGSISWFHLGSLVAPLNPPEEFHRETWIVLLHLLLALHGVSEGSGRFRFSPLVPKNGLLFRYNLRTLSGITSDLS